MTPERLRLRAAHTLGLLMAAFGLLAVRLAWLQLVSAPAAQETAESQHFARREVVRARRGAITDRNGEILAVTQPFPSVAIDPKVVKDPQRLAAAVQRDLGVPAQQALALVAKGGRFRWVKRQVPDRAAVERLRDHLASEKIDGLVVVEEPRRVYPLGALAAQVVGFTDRDGRGLDGVEGLRDRALRGVDGERMVLRDATGIAIARPGETIRPPVDGDDIRLTIDASIQSWAEEEANRIWTDYGALGVSVMVVDVTNGDILADVSRPTFDPNDPSRSTPEQRRNRPFTDAFEPGSVFKCLVMALALDAGVVTPSTRIDTNGGRFVVGRRVIHEDKNKNLGSILPVDAIARSSNCAMAWIGLQMGEARLKPGLTMLGFGARTSVRWPGEQAGDIQAKTKWRPSDQLASISFGHAMTATPAQLAQAYATLAAGGVRRELRLFADAPESEPVRVMSERAARALFPMMEAVVRDEHGTAYAARNQCPDFNVGGKTGTAQKLQTGGHVSSFACFGPTEDPRLAVLVLVDEPKKATYGSVVAAPQALRILRQSLLYLGVRPQGLAPLRTAAAPSGGEVQAR